MEFTIDFESDEAYYKQLRDQIILGIACEALRQGELLPSVRDMAEKTGINMHTVNKTYSILRQQGYLRLDRRRGAVISIEVRTTDKLNRLKESLRVSLAEALCNGISADEVHMAVDQVLSDLAAERSE